MPVTATLQGLILALHFREPLGMTVLDMADWARSVRDDFPEATQSPASPRVEIIPAGLPAQISFVSAPDIPRLAMAAIDGNWNLLLQDDRFALSWVRTEPLGEAGEYPGYQIVLSRWREVIARFVSWHLSRLGGTPMARLVELAYHNARPIRDAENKQTTKIGEVLNSINLQGRAVNSLAMSVTEVLFDDRPNAARVSAQFGLGPGNAFGIGVPDARHSILFSFTGLASLDQPEDPTADEAIEILHARILDIYHSAIKLAAS